jgi:hypothetical protein
MIATARSIAARRTESGVQAGFAASHVQQRAIFHVLS